MPQPLINTIPRPKRWRTSVSGNTKYSPKQWLTEIEQHNVNVNQIVRQSIYEPDYEESTQASVTKHEGQAKTELRFSFAQATNEHRSSVPKTKRRNISGEQATKDKRPDNALSNSFSDLSFEESSALQASASARAREPVSRPNSTVHSFVPIAPQHTPQQQFPNQPSVPFVPDLTKPKREGYGFSFADTIFQDSMEYPDTECDWGSETERDSPNEHDSGFEDASPTPTGSGPLTAIANDTSFDDVVVMRDVGSFHLARPQKRLSCTTATREDTLSVKIAAKKLLKYNESASIYAELVGRLERMVHASLHLPDDNGYITTGTSATTCALKLQDHLLRTKSSRIMTGEVRLLVEHEIEWATWLVEASRTGVMHLKAKGCKCRPDWEEEE